MKEFFSLSSYPGKTGEYYYNHLFRQLEIDASYTALPCNHLKESVESLLDKGAAGFSVSMPFKNDIISYLDSMESLVLEYDSCNTVLITNGKLHGYNTDYFGARAVINKIDYSQKIVILGDGVMGKMISSMLPIAQVCSRQRGNWDKRYELFDVIINCTALGTMSEESPFTYIPETVQLVVDLAVKPNQLEKQCFEAGIKYITGKEFYKYQFLRQFEIYTGLQITEGLFESI